MDATKAAPTIGLQAALLTANRTIVNTGFRMSYPLLPVLARGVGVEISAIATVLTFTQLVGLAAPLMGELAERRSKRFNILLGLSLNVLGLSLVFLIPGFAGLAAALILSAFGKNTLYDPAAQAYIGDRVPYARRGLYMGAMELSWSLAFLLGVPLMAWLIDGYGWRAPFGVLAVGCAVGLLVIAGMLEVDAADTKASGTLLGNFRKALASRTAVAGLVLGFGISAANQMVNVVFGTWIELSFGVALSALAAASAVIGTSELIGEGVVAGLADRFGKRRLVAVGIVVNIAACGLLPLTSFNLVVALGALFVFYLGFEVSLVATIPLASELTPTTRAMYMTLLVTSFTLGRALVTGPATLLFAETGLGVVCLVAAGLNVMALVAVTWGIELGGAS